MTLPAATVVLEAVVMVPTASDTFVIAVVAAAWVTPTTLGTVVVGGPLESCRLTEVPSVTEVPAAGASVITGPAATVVLATVVMVPTASDAFVIAVLAAAWVSPTTLGTVVVGGPSETTSDTDAPSPTMAPAAGA